MDKLKRDISKYENAGVPPEKMNFWNKVGEVFALLEVKASVRDEVHPLSALQSKQRFTKSGQTHGQVMLAVPECVSTALDKDRAPLPEVCD